MDDCVLLAHGSGGKLSHDLLRDEIISVFGNPLLERMDDSAVLDIQGRIAFTTDSYVVTPIFFPGGNIGKIAMCGTINDLAVCGARPLYISVSLVIEEGLSIADLRVILRSMREVVDATGVSVVTGDTKVVNRGCADKLFINTSGLGIIPSGVNMTGVEVGDKVLVSGTLGDHSIAVMSKREGLEFDSPIESDCAPLNRLVASMLQASSQIHCMRDPTRGGLASTLNEIAQQARVGIRIEEDQIPVHEGVRAACELLGFDPLHMANEGKLIAFVAASEAERVLSKMRGHVFGSNAAIIGDVVKDHKGQVVMRTSLGSSRIVDMPVGDILPRIC